MSIAPFGITAANKEISLTADLDSQRAIEALAGHLQSFPGEIRWLYVQQNVILAAATGVPGTPGLMTARIGWVLKWAARLGLDLVAAKLASLILLVAIWCRQSRIPISHNPQNFFVGINALREAELVRHFEAMSGSATNVIDQRFSGALTSIYRPSAWELLRSWRDAARPVFAALASTGRAHVLDRSTLLNYIVRRLHHYAHFLAVFRGLNTSNPGAAVAFSTADLPAFAAVRAGIEAIYFPHGFQRRSLVFPDFRRVVAFNAPDAEHLQSRLPAASVSLSPPVFRPLQVTRCVAVVGDYIEDGASSTELIETCRAAGVHVAVRPHPADRSGYWTTWQGSNGVTIDGEGTFDEFLERHRPCIIATWYSTTVYDALLRGVVPVSFDADQPDVVFPLLDVALSWPQQKERIHLILANATVRHKSFAKALGHAIGPAYVRSAMEQLEALARDLERSA